MCGIAGFYSTDGFFRQENLSVMTDTLKHRGPDSSGQFSDGICGLGHRRLSVIDLSDRATQPMYSSNERYVIVYNGEVYNFQEIGAKLGFISAEKKFVPRSSSDTEIILEAFVQYGNKFIHDLNGMFAFAIYDTLSKELHIYRDRMGIKPLYYYWDGKHFAFASELKALTRLEQIQKTINKTAIYQFLHLGFVPAPHSIYKNIFKLKSGSWLKVTKDGIDLLRYWNLRSKITGEIITREDQAMVKISDLLISSVQYQLKSDVPFGVFLSGGIDSSLVTAQAVMLSSVKINTFSIGFEENRLNESEYAKTVANYLGTEHHEFIVSHNDAIKLIDSITGTYDEPFADSSCIPTMLVSKLARDHVTVTLSGEGGDELFFGYGAYKWAGYLSNPLMSLLRNPVAGVFSKMSSRYQRIARLLDYNKTTNMRSHIFSQEQYVFSEKEIYQILHSDFSEENEISLEIPSEPQMRFINENLQRGDNLLSDRKLTAIEQQALFDLEIYLQDDLLAKVDRASMKYSLETRVPYLDHRLVEFALNLSPDLKFRNGIFKYILKKVLYQYIPKSLFDRPKQGFAIPLSEWLRTSLKYLVDYYLSDNIVMKFGVLNPNEVNKIKKQFFSGSDFLFNRIWQLIILQMWLEKTTGR